MTPRDEARDELGALAEDAAHLKAAARTDEGDGERGSGSETAQRAPSHSGTCRAWAVSLAMVASFLLAAAGMTFGPRTLLWIGVGLFGAFGIYSLAAHAWTDYVRDHRRSP